MTGAIAMIEFTPDAQIRLANYLQQVRAALAGSPDVNPDEIEADIREHVENELHDAPRPVAWTALDAVLTRLGPPSQWGAGGDPSLLRRTGFLLREKLRGAKASLGDRLRSAREAVWRGPEDWRLAYLAFGVFAAGVLVFPFFPLFLLVSYVLARAGVAAAREKGVELSARKWLLYPPLVVVSTVLLIVVLALPVAAGFATGATIADAEQRVTNHDRPNPEPKLEPNHPFHAGLMEQWRAKEAQKERMAKHVEEDRQLLAAIPVAPRWAPAAAALFVGVGACAAWWAVLGLMGGIFPGAVRAVFFPLSQRFRSAHGWLIAGPCAVVLVLWGVAAYEVAASAEVFR